MVDATICEIPRCRANIKFANQVSNMLNVVNYLQCTKSIYISNKSSKSYFKNFDFGKVKGWLVL